MDQSTTERGGLQRAGHRAMAILCSIKLAIIVLVPFAGLSVIGGLIPQNGEYDEYVKAYGATTARLLWNAGLTDLFASWWFLVPAGYLLVSMAACSLRRLPMIWRVARDSGDWHNTSEQGNLTYQRSFTMPLTGGRALQTVMDRLINQFRGGRYRVTVHGEP